MGLQRWLARKIFEREVKRMAEKAPRSYRTTFWGISAILGALAGAAAALLDTDPATNANWTEVWAVISLGLAAIAARDNKS